jgi:hypothetical protein
MMTPDPTEEIKAIRHRFGAEFDYDLDRIVADIQRRQAESGIQYVSLPPRRIANNQGMHAESPSQSPLQNNSTSATG